MSYMGRKKRRGVVTPWKVVRRCVVFFTTICVIPVLLVLLVATDQYLRPTGRSKISLIRPEVGYVVFSFLFLVMDFVFLSIIQDTVVASIPSEIL